MNLARISRTLAKVPPYLTTGIIWMADIRRLPCTLSIAGKRTGLPMADEHEEQAITGRRYGISGHVDLEDYGIAVE